MQTKNFHCHMNKSHLQGCEVLQQKTTLLVFILQSITNGPSKWSRQRVFPIVAKKLQASTDGKWPNKAKASSTFRKFRSTTSDLSPGTKVSTPIPSSLRNSHSSRCMVCCIFFCRLGNIVKNCENLKIYFHTNMYL